MECCKGQAYDDMFDAKTAARHLRDYEKKGATGATKRLLQAVRGALGPDPFTHLDVGGGVGVLQHELAASGATRTTAVDASRPYLDLLEKAAADQGYGDRHRRIEGDLVDVAGDIEPATVVTLDKVICCYPDMDELVEAAAGRATSVLAVTVPRDAFWSRWMMVGMNAGFRHVMRREFRSFVHAHDDIDGVCASAGMPLASEDAGLFWCVRLYRRPPAQARALS
ncbi:MAG: hypothetical protein GY913_14145 [Proteobacteria bacterium]|nr:hypothetical protein [Pseudomonadota bacterium]MCP4918050.1 hypothetical protein [Pseudomonadota bacterium]